MLRVQKIDSLDLPELAPYRTMRQQLQHREQRIFVAEGEKVVRRLLESSVPVLSVLLPEKWLKDYEPLLEARPEEIGVYVAEKKVLEQLTGFSMYQGVLAVGRMPESLTLDQVLQTAPKPYLFVAVDGLSSAQNLGVVARNCAAFGAQALIVGETSSSPYLRRAVRSSMGTIFRLPVTESNDLATTLRDLSARHIRTLAAHPHANGKTLSQTELREDCCLVFGSEGDGIAPQVLAACDEAVAIPMRPGVDSLNVGSASAAFLYEAARQRGKA
jgi:tRNA G18 (ribose-2'-O)-methylase SpoU